MSIKDDILSDAIEQYIKDEKEIINLKKQQAYLLALLVVSGFANAMLFIALIGG